MGLARSTFVCPNGEGEGGERREKGRATEVDVGVHSAKKEIKVKRRRGPEQST